MRVAETVVEAAAGEVPVAMGAQTTSTLELRRLAKAAQRIGCEYIQVSCPFYFHHTEEDFYEYVGGRGEAADDRHHPLQHLLDQRRACRSRLVERLVENSDVVGLKWACPRTDAMEFEDVVSTFSSPR